MLQAAGIAGRFLSSFIWGWAADRFGSKPVALSGSMLAISLPVGWMLMPHDSSWGLVWAPPSLLSPASPWRRGASD